MSFELERGSTLGRYELLVRVGRGGMASVWVARGRPRANEPEQLLAVKAMLPELASNMEFRSMFLDEGQIVGAISHPNVVRVYEVGETNGILYMAMEWVEGDSLHTLIAEANKRRPIPPEVAVRLIADTAGGLHAAHEIRGWDGKLKEIVHCDVSPHNILIGLDGLVKLVDFGVAGAMNQLNTEEEVKIRGKFGYMSPEQAQAKPLDRRSDVFSLGIVLFELTTGYRLFRGRDDRHTLELVTYGKIPRPSQVIPSYPPKLEAIVTKALEREIDKRFQTAEEFKDALETYLFEERILVPAAGVKGLLRRVLGAKIDQRRHQIRASIRALDGSHPGPTLLVSDDPIAAPEEEAISVSVSSADALGERSVSVSQSQSLGAAFLPGDGSSGVQTLSQPSAAPPKSNRFLLLGAALGVVVAGAAVLLLSLRPEEPRVREMARSAAQGSDPGRAAPASAPARHPSDQPTSGLSIDSLPADPAAEAAALLAAQHPKPGTPGAPVTKEMAERFAQDVAAVRAEAHPSDSMKVTLGEDEDQRRVDDIAKSVSLDDKGGTPSSPPSQPVNAGEFDRGAAQAALSRAANLVGMCRRPGGETGPGKAIVTFGASGRAEAVEIQGALGGTPVGDCVARQFRGAKVPPFVGASVTVSKAFVVPD